MADESLTFRAFGTDVSAGRMFGELGDKADDAGDSIHGLGDESKDLDVRLAETREHVRALVTEFEKTGDVSLFRDIRRDRSTISMLESIRKELEQVADEAEVVGLQISKATSGGFADALGAIPSQLKGAAIVAAAGLAVAMAPEIGAVIGGAVLGGVGLGGIVGGVIAAAQDERIAAAGKQLSENFMGGFKESGRIFINPLLDQMSVLQRTEDVVLADLAAGFAKLAPAVRPFAQGLEGLAENLDLDKILGDALPAIRAIGNELPEIGAAIADGLGAIGDEGDGATEGLIATLHAVEDLIRGGGEFIGWLAGVFDWLVRTDKALTQWALDALDVADSLSFLTGGATIAQLGVARDHLQGVNDEMNSLVDGLHDANDAGRDWRGNLSEQARAAREAAKEALDYKDALEKLFGIQMGLDEAQIRYQQAIDDTLETLKDGKRTLDINTQDGRDNAQAVLDQVSAIEDLRQANIENGTAVADANANADGQIERLRTTLIRLGFNKQAVHDLIDAYIELKRNAYVSTHVEDKSVQIAYNHVKAVEAEMERLNGNVATIFVNTVHGGKGGGIFDPPGRASGGPVMAGNSYWVGENGPEIVTFGRNGTVIPAAKSAALAGTVAAAAPQVIEFRLVGGDEELRRWFKKSVRVYGGGNVQMAFGES